MTRGGTGANQYTTEQIHQSDVSAKKRNGNAAKIAEEHGIGELTVLRSEKFAKGVDEAEKAVPGTNLLFLKGDETMFIDPFWCGVFVTIAVEVVALIAAALIKGARR